MSSRLGRALRGLSFVCVWLAALPALAQIRNEGAIPDGRGGVNALTIGAHHTCGIRQDGTAMCWGDNWYGETRPLPGTFIELSAGFGHTCGLRGDGGVACWGAGYTPVPGEPEPPMPPPSPVPAGRFTTISSAMSTTCGLRARSVPWEYPEGNVACWSASGWQLPAPPQGDFVALSVGNEFACALRANGKPVCWGYINPEQVPAEDTFIAISAGAHHACGLRADGSVRCWGDHWAGQATPPADLFTAISAGSFNTCGLRPDGTALCWGENGSGQSSPPSPERFTAITGGESHACGLRPDGHVACWGNVNWNFYPDPPPPYTMPPLLPQDTVFGMGQLAAGDGHDCQINAQGELACWGGFAQEPEPAVRFGTLSSGWEATCARDGQGQLRCYGANEMMRIDLPFEPLRQFDLGYEHGCGVSALDGSPRCWGRETDGKTLPPTEPPGQLFRNTSAGLMHSCGVTADGAGQCWGYNGDGETSVPTPSPERGYLHVDAGERHSCGLDSALNIFCWGMSPQPSEPGYYDPDAPPEFPSFRALSAGGYHSCAIRTDGRLLCWGANWSGQLQAPEGTFVAVSAGHSHTCAIRTDGSRACWGEPWLTPRLVLDPDRVRELRPGEWAHIPFQLRSESPYQLREPRYAIVAGTLPMGFWFDPEGVLRGSSNEPGRYPLTVEGRDRNGFAARRDFVLAIDGTPPVIEPQVTGTLGDNGWYTSAVTLAWSVTDPESEVLGSYGCEPVTLESDAETQFSCSAHSAGGVAHQEVVIKLDRVPPDTHFTGAPPVAGNDPNGEFTFTGTDAISGVQYYECRFNDGAYFRCDSGFAFTTVPGQHTFEVRAVDFAGNRDPSPARHAWFVDTTPPAIAASVSGPLGYQGWYVGDVQVGWSVSDPDSSVTSTSGCNAVTLASDTIGADFVCTATSTGGTAAKTVTIKRDTTPPETTIGSGPGAQVGTTSATFAFSGSDAASGMRYYECSLDGGAFNLCTSPYTYNVTSGAHTFAVRAMDAAGHRDPTPATYTWTVDLSPPDIGLAVSGGRGTSAWYVTDVHVDWQVSDAGSTITSTEGCDDLLIDADTTGRDLLCTATSAGGTVSRNVSIRRDTVAPETTLTSTPDAQTSERNAAFSFAGLDSTAGVTGYECDLDGQGYVPCASPYAYSGLPAGAHRFEVRAVDGAGHRDASPAVHDWRIDTSAPVIQPTVSGTLSSNGWYVGDVQIAWAVSEPDSSMTTTGCDAVNLVTDAIGASFTCTATSAGGTSSRSVTIRRDATAPVIGAVATTVPNVAGWYRDDVTVAFNCSDEVSGVMSCPTAQVLGGEAAGIASIARTVTDAAGNRATSNVVVVNIDRTAPVLAPGVAPGTLLINATASANPNASDTLSGIASKQCDALATGTTGTRTVSCTATDAAGNSAGGSANYRVVYGFNGFNSPVQNPSVLNVLKAGRSVPFRWRVVDAQGAPVDTLTVAAVRAVPIACPNATENRVASYGSGNGQLQNLGNGYYQLDWAAANSLRGACRSLELDLGDGELHSALFKFN